MAINIGVRGLGGIVITRGVDDLVRKMKNKFGGSYVVVDWNQKEAILAQIKKDIQKGVSSGPIRIVGHSLGARSGVWLANNLVASGHPVHGLVVLDYVRPTFPWSLWPGSWYKVDNRVGASYHLHSKDARVANLPGAIEFVYPQFNHVDLAEADVVHNDVLDLME